MPAGAHHFQSQITACCSSRWPRCQQEISTRHRRARSEQRRRSSAGRDAIAAPARPYGPGSRVQQTSAAAGVYQRRGARPYRALRGPGRNYLPGERRDASRTEGVTALLAVPQPTRRWCIPPPEACWAGTAGGIPRRCSGPSSEARSARTTLATLRRWPSHRWTRARRALPCRTRRSPRRRRR